VERAAKKELVAELNGVFKDTNVVVVAHYSGLTVFQMQNLRRQMKQAGASVKVAKNRLAKIALAGTGAAVIVPLLKGPTVIAYSRDPVAAPKVANDFAKTHEKFVILGGAMGTTALNPDGIKALAVLPSLATCPVLSPISRCVSSSADGEYSACKLFQFCTPPTPDPVVPPTLSPLKTPVV